MSYLAKKLTLVLVVGLFSMGVASSSFAEETKSENSFGNFLKKLFHVPVKTTQNVADMTGHALSNTGENVLSKTGEELSKGNIAQAVVQPVVAAPPIVGQAASETVQAVPDAVASNPDSSQTPAEPAQS